jgi:hypothetical protein
MRYQSAAHAAHSRETPYFLLSDSQTAGPKFRRKSSVKPRNTPFSSSFLTALNLQKKWHSYVLKWREAEQRSVGALRPQEFRSVSGLPENSGNALVLEFSGH